MSLLSALACRRNQLFHMSRWVSFQTFSLYPSWEMFTSAGSALLRSNLTCLDLSGIFNLGDVFSSQVKALTGDTSWGT